jgi:hypothetical protein
MGQRRRRRSDGTWPKGEVQGSEFAKYRRAIEPHFNFAAKLIPARCSYVFNLFTSALVAILSS